MFGIKTISIACLISKQEETINNRDFISQKFRFLIIKIYAMGKCVESIMNENIFAID